MVVVSISLPDQIKQYMDNRLHEGGYRDTSEFVSDLIREDQKRRADERLETLLLKGLDSGEPIELTPETVQQMRAELIERIQREVKSGN